MSVPCSSHPARVWRARSHSAWDITCQAQGLGSGKSHPSCPIFSSCTHPGTSPVQCPTPFSGSCLQSSHVLGMEPAAEPGCWYLHGGCEKCSGDWWVGRHGGQTGPHSLPEVLERRRKAERKTESSTSCRKCLDGVFHFLKLS